jgi:outer membrane lipoprotein carrier protein
MRKSLLTTAIFAFTLLFVAQSFVFGQHPDTVLRQMQNKFDSIRTLRADFMQTMLSGPGAGTQTVSGKIMLRGDRYRIETRDQTFVTNTQTSWVYSASQNQLLVSDYEQDETTFSPTDFFTRTPKDYTSTLAGSERLNGVQHHLLRLTPTNRNSAFREVTLWVRQNDALVTRAEVTDQNNTKMRFELSNIEVNPRLPISTFRFSAPAGADVIDLR